MRNKYRFFADIGGDTIEFPVNPTKYTISYPTDHAEYNVLDIGDIIVPKLPSLMEVSWESYFPGHQEMCIRDRSYTDGVESTELWTSEREWKIDDGELHYQFTVKAIVSSPSNVPPIESMESYAGNIKN